MQAAKASGSLTLERMMDMKEAGVDVDSLVSEELRLQMYTKEVGAPAPPCTALPSPAALWKPLGQPLNALACRCIPC